jgi:tryptophan halogenase
MKIIVVGGGTAGWLAALFISKMHPEHDLVVIESSAIGIVGAGEGSTGLLTNVVAGYPWDFGCNHYDFLKETGATLKYGIKHVGWTPENNFYYGPLDGTMSTSAIPDGAFAYQHSMDHKKLHTVSEMGLLLETEKSNVNRNTKKFTNYGHALHFDAHKVGKYFKKIVLKNTKIKHIDSEVLDITLNETGFLSSLKLKNQEIIDGDFFIDASGFSRVLMKKLETPWVSYNKNLPVNSAMPFILDYKEGEMLDPYTTAWAQGSGWMWQIPVLERKGCGYVFDDNFITPEQAQAEIETTLGRSIDPIRVLKFQTGRLENTWVKNCLAIGLSAAFAEPLEATSIHSTIVQLTKFVFEYLKPTSDLTINQGSINNYNRTVNRMYDDFKEFLVLHYMGGRTDSEFWKYISSGATKTEFVNNIIEMSKSKIPTFNDFNEYYGAAGWPLWAWVLAGTNNLSAEISRQELNWNVPGFGNLGAVSKTEVDRWKAQTSTSLESNFSYHEFIEYLKTHG